MKQTRNIFPLLILFISCLLFNAKAQNRLIIGGFGTDDIRFAYDSSAAKNMGVNYKLYPFQRILPDREFLVYTGTDSVHSSNQAVLESFEGTILGSYKASYKAD